MLIHLHIKIYSSHHASDPRFSVANRGDVLEDIKADATAVEVAVDRDVKAGIDLGIGMKVDVGVDVEDEVEDEVESSDRGTMEVGVDVVTGIDIPDAMLMLDAVESLEQVEEGQRELEAKSLIAGGERASLLEQVASLERSNTRLRGTMMMERARADRFRRREALAAYEATRGANALEAKSYSQNGALTWWNLHKRTVGTDAAFACHGESS
ncbi:hypothetical protein Tco_0496878 [Tanacetum coccineum]